MANIPGLSGYVQPNTYSRVRTVRRSVAIPGGIRILSIIGLGQSVETVVLEAEGGGADGVNANYAASDSPDGRHFVLSKTNLIPNRTTLLLNSVPLSGFEDTIDLAAFDGRYDYRLEPATGRIELQRAFLVDQGGQLVVASTSNVGDGTVTVELIDGNAPKETWTLRATSVVRDAYGDSISGNATFSLIGSVSGQPLDAYGAPVTFISDSVARDNGVLRVTIAEGATAFERGDRFTIKVNSRVLSKGDTLEARYIATEDLNDPQFFTDANDLFLKHGFPSETNTLSLGASMAFENGAPGVMALQAKPPIARRTSEVVVERDDPLSEEFEGYPPVSSPPTSSDVDAFRFPITGIPDADTTVNFFVIDRSGGTETAVFPTKVDFYNSYISNDHYNNFIDNPNYTYSYTVVLDGQVEDKGDDGEVTAGSSNFTAASGAFAGFNVEDAESDTFKQIRILNRDKYGNDASDVAGVYDILSVGGGVGDNTIVTLTNASAGGVLPFAATATDLVWELVDPADESARVLITKDLAVQGTIRRRDGLRVTYIDTNDANFFDANWAAALEALERVDTQIVVPLPDSAISAIQQATVQHCILMSNTANQKERVALIGAQQNVTAAALIGQELIAVEDIGVIEGIQGDDAAEVLAGNIEDLQNFKVSDNYGTTFRASYFFPDQIVRTINGTNTFIHGFYMAAAAGGRLSGTANVAVPLTRKNLTGFSILRDRTYRPVIQNALGNVGVTLVVPVIGGGQILHSKTTTASGAPEEEELSIVFIRDKVAAGMRDVLRPFIGQVNDPTVVAGLTMTAQKTLEGYIAQGILTSYRNLSVKRDAVEPRQYNVTVEVAPAAPINWIFIDASVSIA